MAALAGDDFAGALREHYAAKRPTKAEVAPLHASIERVRARIDAIHGEFRLRELDTRRAEEEAQRNAALEAVRAGATA
jgi:uncharacterized membrane protein